MARFSSLLNTYTFDQKYMKINKANPIKLFLTEKARALELKLEKCC